MTESSMFLWTGVLAASTLLLLVAWAANRLLAARGATVRHLIWAIAFVGAFAIPLGVRFIPGYPIPVKVVETMPFAAAKPGAVEAVEDFGFLRNELAALPPHPRSPSELILVVWAAGALVVVGRAGIALAGLATLSRASRRATIESLDTASLSRKAGVARSWDLRVCPANRLSAAMTWGVFRPVVALPQNAASWPRERLEAVLLHELAHVRRLDSLSQLISVLVCALYWFNPVVWLCARAMRAEAESAADDAVLRSGVAASDYAELLVSIAASLGRRRPVFAPMGLSIMKKSKIERRIAVILNPRARRGASAAEALAIAGAGLAATFSLMLLRPAVVQRAAPAPEVTVTQSLQVQPTPVPQRAAARRRGGHAPGPAAPQAPVPATQGTPAPVAPATTHGLSVPAPGTPAAVPAVAPQAGGISVAGQPAPTPAIAPVPASPALGTPVGAAPTPAIPVQSRMPVRADGRPLEVPTAVRGRLAPQPPQTLTVQTDGRRTAVTRRGVEIAPTTGRAIMVPAQELKGVTVVSPSGEQLAPTSGRVTTITSGQVRGKRLQLSPTTGRVIAVPSGELTVTAQGLQIQSTTGRSVTVQAGQIGGRALVSPQVERERRSIEGTIGRRTLEVTGVLAPRFDVQARTSRVATSLLVPGRQDDELTSFLKEEIQKDSTLGRFAKRLFELRRKAEKLQSQSNPDSVEMARVQLEISKVEYDIAVQMKRLNQSPR